MESRKFFFAAISALLFLIFALPAYAEVRNFSGEMQMVADPMGHFDNVDIDSSSSLSGSVTFDITNMIETEGDRYIESPTQINMMLGTLSFNQDDTDFITRLYFDDSDNLIGIDFCTPEYKYFGGDSHGFKFKSDDITNYTTFKIWANDDYGTTLEGIYNFNPIPIPAAIWLLGSGLLGLAGLNRKCKKI